MPPVSKSPLYNKYAQQYGKNVEVQDESLLLTLLKKNILIIGIGLCGLLLLGYGMYQLWQPKDDEIVFENNPTITSQTTSTPSVTKKIIVDIEGAVMQPGVYSLPENSRIQDALSAAGGLSTKADREALAKGLNLAAKVTDASKLYIPSVGEAASGEGSVQGMMTSVNTDQTDLISINSASESELDKLPGIGPVTAGKIISNRPFTSLEELISKKAVSSSTFAKIKDKISL